MTDFNGLPASNAAAPSAVQLPPFVGPSVPPLIRDISEPNHMTSVSFSSTLQRVADVASPVSKRQTAPDSHDSDDDPDAPPRPAPAPAAAVGLGIDLSPEVLDDGVTGDPTSPTALVRTNSIRLVELPANALPPLSPQNVTPPAPTASAPAPAAAPSAGAGGECHTLFGIPLIERRSLTGPPGVPHDAITVVVPVSGGGLVPRPASGSLASARNGERKSPSETQQQQQPQRPHWGVKPSSPAFPSPAPEYRLPFNAPALHSLDIPTTPAAYPRPEPNLTPSALSVPHFAGRNNCKAHTLSVLSHDMLAIAFKFLTPIELIRFATPVCSTWRAVVNLKHVWSGAGGVYQNADYFLTAPADEIRNLYEWIRIVDPYGSVQHYQSNIPQPDGSGPGDQSNELRHSIYAQFTTGSSRGALPPQNAKSHSPVPYNPWSVHLSLPPTRDTAVGWNTSIKLEHQREYPTLDGQPDPNEFGMELWRRSIFGRGKSLFRVIERPIYEEKQIARAAHLRKLKALAQFDCGIIATDENISHRTRCGWIARYPLFLLSIAAALAFTICLLLRWRHGESGGLPDDDTSRALETYGLIVPLLVLAGVVCSVLIVLLVGTCCDTREAAPAAAWMGVPKTALSYGRVRAAIAATVAGLALTAALLAHKIENGANYPFTAAIVPLLAVCLMHIVLTLWSMPESHRFCLNIFDMSKRLNRGPIEVFYIWGGLLCIGIFGSSLLAALFVDGYLPVHTTSWYFIFFPLDIFHGLTVFVCGFYAVVFWSDRERGGFARPTMRRIFWSWSICNVAAIVLELVVSRYWDTLRDADDSGDGGGGAVFRSGVVPSSGVQLALIIPLFILSVMLPVCVRETVSAAGDYIDADDWSYDHRDEAYDRLNCNNCCCG